MSGAVAFAFAAHVITVPLSVPVAVPVNFRPPAHDALNDPSAEFPVCFVGFHLKSVHVDAAGMTLVVSDVQVPSSEATPVELGPVVVVLFS